LQWFLAYISSASGASLPDPYHGSALGPRWGTSAESVGSRRELVANSVHTADATERDSWVVWPSGMYIGHEGLAGRYHNCSVLYYRTPCSGRPEITYGRLRVTTATRDYSCCCVRYFAMRLFFPLDKIVLSCFSKL